MDINGVWAGAKGYLFGTKSDINKKYYGYGQSGWSSGIDVMNAVLSKLSAAGVVFDLEDKSHEALFQKLLEGSRLCLTQDQWPRVYGDYSESPRLIEAVKSLRVEMGFSELDRVLG